MALSVEITGGENIDQGEQVTLAATVTDANGNTPPGTLQYAWSASRGTFIGETDEATAVYHADFTDASDVDVTITCAVTRPANDSPTVSSGSLTAMAALGITGQILNIFLNPTADTNANARSNIHPGGTIVNGSDTVLASNINITQLEWNDNTNRFIMTGSGGGNIGTFFSGNTAQSVYIIFSDGTLVELDSTLIAVTTSSRVQWNVTDATLQQKFVDLDGVQSLLVGVGDSDSVGWAADSGTDTDTFTAAAINPLTVNITGTTDIEQGQQTTLTAAVTDADGNAVTSGLIYAWSVDMGTFIGDTDEATVVYHADFVDTGEVDVAITCAVTRAADSTPTSSGAALTAMTEIGITGQILNMFLNPAGAVSPNANNNIYQSGTTGTLVAGSDAALASNITINRVRWNNAANRFILNSSGGGNLNNFWSGNTSQSIFLIFEDGEYIELPNSAFVLGGNTWAQFDLTDTDIRALLNAFDGTDTLLIGVGDTGSIGVDAAAGSGMVTVTAAVAIPLSIEAVDEQFITVGTEDYDLVINIHGNPDSAKATGHMEGFGQDWDAAQSQLHIKSEEATRLINGVNWDIEVVKDMQTLMGQVAYNVVKAAPIFASLETIHLYRGVSINFDIVIQNIPPLLIPDAELLGLKSELLEYGINVKGEISATDNFVFNSGNVRIIVPGEGGGADTVYDYPYEIEDGTPPSIGSVSFIAKGHYGELTFPDVTHALGYEWTLDTGDDPTWNLFDSTRQIINPGEIEMTLGHLSVTVKFPNVPGASSYEYQLVTEDGEGLWIEFTGMLANGFITTIIPNLQEGVEYTLRLRVASPWVGTPVSVTVFGGRTCYTLQINGSDRDNQWLYIYHTGHRSGEHASRIKRLLLPTSLSHPENGGVAVDSDGNVYIIHNQGGVTGEKALYTFNKATIDNASDGSRLTQDLRNPFPSGSGINLSFVGMDFYGGNLYMYLLSAGANWGGLQIINIPTTDGAVLTRTTSTNRPITGVSVVDDVSATVESFWFLKGSQLWHTDRDLLTGDTRLILFDSTGRTQVAIQDRGLDVIGEDNIYNQSRNQLQLFRVNPEVHASNHILDFFLELPAGLTNPRFLSVST